MTDISTHDVNGSIDDENGDSALKHFDETLFDELMETYGWAFKPLVPLGSFTMFNKNIRRAKKKDIQLVNRCNEILLEYFEDELEIGGHANVGDKRIMRYVMSKLAIEFGDGNIPPENEYVYNHYQKCSQRARLVSDYDIGDMYVPIEEHKKALEEATSEEWEDGYDRGYDKGHDKGYNKGYQEAKNE